MKSRFSQKLAEKPVVSVIGLCIAVAALCVMVFFVHNFYSSLNSMENIQGEKLIKKVKSPSGKYEVEAYLNNGGATTDYAILVVWKDLKNGEKKNIYWNYPCEEAKINWHSDDKIEINSVVLQVPDEVYDYRNDRDTVSGNVISGSAVSGEAVSISDEKYGIDLPELAVFKEELENLIYWQHAKEISPDSMDCIYHYLEEANALDKELSVVFYYREEEWKDYDYIESNFYSIKIVFPELNDMVVNLEYNARGLTSDVEFWEDEEEIEYKKWGEETICVEEKKAKEYQPSDNMTEEKKEILKAIEKEVEKYKGKDSNYSIYIQDFLPGSSQVSGYVLTQGDLEEYEVPLSYLHGMILYEGKKMENYSCFVWNTRHSTAFNGGEWSEKVAKQMVKGTEGEIQVERCLAAYRIEGNKITPIMK